MSSGPGCGLGGKMIVRFWAAVTSDFETILAAFLSSPNWDFETFAKVAAKFKLPMLMNITMIRGKNRDCYYEAVCSMILEAAREIWLGDSNNLTQQHQPNLALRKAIAGLYLTYLLHDKQPIRGKCGIPLDAEYVEKLTKFMDKIKEGKLLPKTQAEILQCTLKQEEASSAPLSETQKLLRAQILFILARMEVRGAFEYSAVSTQMGIEGWRRSYLTVREGSVAAELQTMRQVNDLLAYSPHGFSLAKHGEGLEAARQEIRRKAAGILSPEGISYRDANPRNLPELNLNLSSMENDELWTALRSMTQRVKELVNVPVLTLRNLVSIDALERKILSETRTRVERFQRKALKNPRAAPKNPYLREGGIYGKKKDKEEDREARTRRERGHCSGNLWTYIMQLPFGQPIPKEEQPEIPPPPTTEEQKKRESETAEDDSFEEMQVQVEPQPGPSTRT